MILWYGGHQVLDGNLEVGDIIAFNLYVVMLIVPLRLAGQLVAQAARASASAGRIFEVLETDPAITDPTVRTRCRPTATATLRFEGVRFRYGAGPVVLDEFDLEVRAGEAVAIVGPTASGKTTVARADPALLRRRATGGSLLDGVDVRELRLHDLRRAGRHRVRGHLPLHRHRAREHRVRRLRGRRSTRCDAPRSSPVPPSSSTRCPTATTP